MRTHRLASPLLLLLACGPGSSDTGDGSTTDDTTGPDAPTTSSAPTSTTETDDTTETDATTGPMTDDPGPQSTPWQVVVDALPFPLADIHRVQFGRKEFNGNFANRGDIEVLFDQDAEVITVEMRKYDFSDALTAFGDEAMGIVGTLERISPWAYNEGADSPQHPSAMNPAADCLVDTWKDDCALYVHYDGQSQPIRSGADLRVHLPKAYRGELHVQTEDNESEATFPRRGDITITGDGDAGWCGSGTVKLSAGVAEVRLCRDLTPAPTCSDAEILDCETFQVDGVPAAWHPDCMCKATQFGQLRVESLKPWAADITVDMPGTTWLNATLANQSMNIPHDCKPALTNCTDDSCVLKDDGEFSKAAEFNYPSDAAPSGAGFNLAVLSAGCAEVEFFADEYAPWDPNTPPLVQERGHVTVCTDCL
jgi:hypothetical protein